MRRPLLPRAQYIKMGRLLNMMYRPVEIAEEIGVNPDTIYRSYLPAGAPHTRDAKGNIWIHGLSFAAWAKETVSKKKAERRGLPEGYAWCMKCNQAVPLTNPAYRKINHYLELMQAPCPGCGKTINRARAREKGAV